jgi:MATE family multidrug resistance protein
MDKSMSEPASRSVGASWSVADLRTEAGQLLILGLPVIGSQLAQIAMNFVDTVMAGNLSPQALAAVAMGSSIWSTTVLFVIGLLMAVTASVSQLFGAGRHEEIGRFVRQALWLSQGLGLCCFVLIRNIDPLFFWLEIEQEIIPTTLGYLDAITWGLPALCGFIVLRHFSEGVSITRPVLLISLIGLLTNIAGNYVFMYGRLGLPAMGAIGCGWATALVMWMMLLSMTVYVLVQPYYRRFHLFRRFDWPRRDYFVETLVLGLPIGISLFLEAGLFTTVALLMGSLGINAVAGHQIAINFASITFMVPLGLSMAITVRVGQALGRGSPGEGRRSAFVGLVLALSFMAASATTMVLFPETIVGIYTDDPAVRKIAMDLLLMAAIFQISDGAQVAGAGALRGLKDTTVPMLMTLVAYWGFGLPLGYTLGVVRSMGPQAMWLGLIAGLTVAAVCLNSRFYWVTRRPATDAPV